MRCADCLKLLIFLAVTYFFSVINPINCGAQQKNNTGTILELNVDNDIVFLIDRYYSSGVSFSVYSPWMKKSPFNHLLLPHNSNEKVYYSLSVTHRMYTPERTLTPEIQHNDYPYSSYLLFGNHKMSFSSENLIKRISGFEIGVIGPAAGGENIQNGLHENIPFAETSLGWHNQIKNDFCLQYNVLIEKGLINLHSLEFNGFVGAKIGVPHTQAHIGAGLRAGIFDDYFKGMGVDLSSEFRIWMFIRGCIYLVNYNAVLQGGTINQNNVHTFREIEKTLLHGKFGGVLQYRNTSIEYGMEVRSPEFVSAFWHRWAHIAMVISL